MPKMEMGRGGRYGNGWARFYCCSEGWPCEFAHAPTGSDSSHGPDLSPQPARIKIKAMKTNSFDMARQQ
jgi:hypothetical protein